MRPQSGAIQVAIIVVFECFQQSNLGLVDVIGAASCMERSASMPILLHFQCGFNSTSMQFRCSVNAFSVQFFLQFQCRFGAVPVQFGCRFTAVSIQFQCIFNSILIQFQCRFNEFQGIGLDPRAPDPGPIGAIRVAISAVFTYVKQSNFGSVEVIGTASCIVQILMYFLDHPGASLPKPLYQYSVQSRPWELDVTHRGAIRFSFCHSEELKLTVS